MDALRKFKARAILWVFLMGGLLLAFQNCGQSLKTDENQKFSITSVTPPTEDDDDPPQGPQPIVPDPVDPEPVIPKPEEPTPDGQLALSADMVSHPAPGGTPIQVNNVAELITELGRAHDGTRIVLKAGTYDGNLNISANGTAANPIVIEGGGAARISGRITLTGSHIWFHRLTLDKGAEITGRYNIFTHNQFRVPDHSAFLLLKAGGQFNKIGFNRFHSAPVTSGSLTKMIAIHMQSRETLTNMARGNLVYRNVFTSDAFTTSGPGNRSIGIYIAGYDAHLLDPAVNRIEQNLFLNLDYQWAIQIKSVANIVRQNTFLGKGVGSHQARALLQLAHGKENLVESNYFEDTMGVSVNEGNFEPNKIIGNKLVRSMIDANYGFESLAAKPKDSLTKLYASIGNLFIKNDGLLRIGSACDVFCEHGAGPIMKADRNVVKAHQGGLESLTLGTHQTNTIIEPTTSEIILPAIKILPTDTKFGPSN